MKTENDIRTMIEAIEDLAQDHHLLLNPPLMRDAILSHYDSSLRLLRWVLDEPVQNLEESPT